MVVKSDDPILRTTTVGFLASVATTVVGHPMDTLKVRLVNGECKGLARGLFRGVSSPVIGTTPCWTLSFMIYAKSVSHFGDNDKFAHWKAGAAAGAFWGGLMTPFEVVKTFSQKNRISSATAYNTLRDRGMRSFTRGMGITMGRDIFGLAIYFGMYERLRRGHNYSAFSAGALSGAMCWSAVFFPDLIKTRYQSNYALTGVMGTIKDLRRVSLVKHVGYTFPLIILRAVITHGLSWALIEGMTDFLDERDQRRLEAPAYVNTDRTVFRIRASYTDPNALLPRRPHLPGHVAAWASPFNV